MALKIMELSPRPGSFLWNRLWYYVQEKSGIQTLPRTNTWMLVVRNLLASAGDAREGLNPWVGKIPLRRKWQPIPVFLPGKFHRQRSWWATVHGTVKSWTWLSTVHETDIKLVFWICWILLLLFIPPHSFWDMRGKMYIHFINPSLKHRPWSSAVQAM